MRAGFVLVVSGLSSMILDEWMEGFCRGCEGMGMKRKKKRQMLMLLCSLS
jgi:hypothetical protein